MIEAVSAAPPREAGKNLSWGLSAGILVSGCTLLALVLRALFAARSGLWRDEALFLSIVRFPAAGDILQFLRLHESHPPLFYFLMRGWLRVWGESETAALALPVLLGALLIPVLYYVGCRVFSRQAGLTAAFLAALSGALAENAALVRPYSLLPLLCLMSVYFLWRGLTGGGLRPWLAHALCTAALLYTHNWSWLVLGAQWALTAVCLALRVLNNPGAERRAAFRSVTRNWLLAQALVFTLYGPWLPVLAFQAQHAGHGGARAAKLFPSLAQFATIIVPLPGDYAAVFCAALAAVALWAACRGRPAGGAGGSPAPDGPPAVVRQTALLLFLGVPLLAFSVAVALNAKSLLLLPRCLTMLAPCALLVVAHAIASVPARPYVRLLAVQIAAVGLAYVSLLLLTQIKSNARELAAAVAAAARPTDLIVITPEQLGSSFNFYYKEPNDQINFPEQHRQEVTRFDDWVKRCGAPEALAATRRRISEARRKNQRVWLVVLEGEFLSDVPDDERKMPRYWTNTNFVGVVRSSQILQELIRLYGPPNQDAVPLDRRGGDEVMTALLFEPAT